MKTICLSVEEKVLLTFERNGITRKQMAQILLCSIDCVNTRIIKARQNARYDALE
jgi:hypothetical protein